MDEPKDFLQTLWWLITAAAIFGAVNLGITLIRSFKSETRFFKIIGLVMLAVGFEIALAEIRSFDIASECRSTMYVVKGVVGRVVECTALWAANYYMSGDRNGKPAIQERLDNE